MYCKIRVYTFVHLLQTFCSKLSFSWGPLELPQGPLGVPGPHLENTDLDYFVDFELQIEIYIYYKTVIHFSPI